MFRLRRLCFSCVSLVLVVFYLCAACVSCVPLALVAFCRYFGDFYSNLRVLGAGGSNASAGDWRAQFNDRRMDCAPRSIGVRRVFVFRKRRRWRMWGANPDANFPMAIFSTMSILCYVHTTPDKPCKGR